MSKIKLSMMGGSGMGIAAFKFCPYSMKLAMDGWEVKKKSAALATGTLFHANMENRLKKEPVQSAEELKHIYEIGAFVEKYGEETYETVFEPNEEEGEALVRMLEKGSEVIESGAFGKIEQVEQKVEHDLMNPETGEEINYLPVVFTGKIDIVSRCSDGLLEIRDLKTSKSGLKQQDADFSEQLTMYSYLYIMENKEMVERVALDVFTKHKRGCRYEKLNSVRRMEDWNSLYENLFRIGIEVEQALELNDWPKTGELANCASGKFGQLCPFHAICKPHKYGSEELELAKSHLVLKEK